VRVVAHAIVPLTRNFAAHRAVPASQSICDIAFSAQKAEIAISTPVVLGIRALAIQADGRRTAMGNSVTGIEHVR